MTPSPTVLPADVFRRLAEGGGDIDGVLGSGRRSKRLLLIHELVTKVRAASARAFLEPDAMLDGAISLLDDVGRQAPTAVDGVLLQPHVGAWATHCLRQLANDGDVSPEDIGHLGAIAASAALRAGRPFDVTASVRRGEIMFPTFGLARVGRRSGWCRVRSHGRADGVEISGRDWHASIPFARPDGDGRWLPLRYLRSSAGGLAVEVQLDDVDPLRGCGQLPVAGRLGVAELEEWQANLDAAWDLLVRHDRPLAEAIGSGIETVVPLRPGAQAVELSASCHEAIGAVATTPPRRPLALALALVHEYQHTKLSALLDVMPLLDRSPGCLFYAPWRSDPRPLRGLLHGTYAFLGLTCFWSIHRFHHSASPDAPRREWAHFEYALGLAQVGAAVVTLSWSGRLTEAGVRFVHGMRRRLAREAAASVPAAVRALARLACRDHYTGWRLRNARPDPNQVGDWADAWLAGRTCRWSGRPRMSLVDGGGPAPSEPRVALMRHRVGFPDRPATDADANSAARWSTAADVHLLDGRSDRAAEGYLARIAQSSDDLPAWSGLALALRAAPGARTWALTTHPECVRAVHAEVRSRTGTAPAPDDLALWMSASSE